MSNLSELLPTGGGQNVVEFVANGNLSSGQAVRLKSDGKVEVITGATGSQAIYSAVDYGGGAPNNTKGYGVAYSTNANKFVFLYTNSSYYLYAVVGTISGNGFTYGTPIVLTSRTTYAGCLHYNSTNATIFFAYSTDDAPTYGYVRGASISGTSLSLGSELAFSTASTAPEFMQSVFDTSTNRHILMYGVSDPYPLKPYVAAFSGSTSMSLQIAKTATSGLANSSVNISYDSSQNACLLFGSTTSAHQWYRAMTTSGSSFTFGTAVTNSGVTVQPLVVASGFDKTTNKHLIGFRAASGNNNRLYLQHITLSGTTITYGGGVYGPTSITGPALNCINIWYDEVGKTITAAYLGFGEVPSKIFPVDTSGSAPVVGTVVTGETAQPSKAIHATSGLSANASYRNALTTMASSGAPRVFLYQNAYASSDNADLIGITAEAISSGATGPVNVLGGINTAQSGLTIASDYYVQGDGTISTTSTGTVVKVGRAISATTINMKDLT